MTHLMSSQLTSTDLTNTDLTSTDLTSADLTSADMEGADLMSAEVSSADLSTAGLTTDPAARDAPPLTHGLLRFATAGSVDDGKSTLVGRLLYDSKSVLSDTLAAAERTSAARGSDTVDLSLLVDGLRAEREQGITIDVAYRYFATAKRTFILADTPGHVQYTRNTVTGASTADVVIILVDARTGVVAQTRRHATVAALLGVPEILLAVNKIDLVDFDRQVFDGIAEEFSAYATSARHPGCRQHPDLGAARRQCGHPVRADRLVSRAERAGAPGDRRGRRRPGTQSAALPGPVRHPSRLRLRRRSGLPRLRGAGRRGHRAPGRRDRGAAGRAPHDGHRHHTADGSEGSAVAGESVTLLLADNLDIARGNLIAAAESAPTPTTEFLATVTQVNDKALRPGQRLLLKYGTRITRVIIGPIDHLLDVDTLTPLPEAASLQLNDIGLVHLRTAEPLPIDDYQPGGAVGALLIIDPADGITLAAGMVGDRRAAITSGRDPRCMPGAESTEVRRRHVGEHDGGLRGCVDPRPLAVTTRPPSTRLSAGGWPGPRPVKDTGMSTAVPESADHRRRRGNTGRVARRLRRPARRLRRPARRLMFLVTLLFLAACGAPADRTLVRQATSPEASVAGQNRLAGFPTTAELAAFGAEATSLRLGYFPSLTHASAVLGVADGTFQRAIGATVLDTSLFNAGPAAVEALAGGAIDAAFLGPNPAINAYAKSHGDLLRIVAGATANGASLVVSPSITSVDQLRGTTLATPQLGGTQDVALRTFLLAHGLRTDTTGGDDVSIASQDNAQTLALYKSGDIQGAWLPEPWASRLIVDGGAHELVDESTLWADGRFPTTVLVVAKPFLDQYPGTVARLVAGHLGEIAKIAADPADAQTRLNDALKAVAGKRLAAAVIERAFARIVPTYDPLAEHLAELSRDGVAAGTLPSAPDLTSIYDLRILNSLLTAAGKTPVSAGGFGQE